MFKWLKNMFGSKPEPMLLTQDQKVEVEVEAIAKTPLNPKAAWPFPSEPPKEKSVAAIKATTKTKAATPKTTTKTKTSKPKTAKPATTTKAKAPAKRGRKPKTSV